jgi:hypothetical protein
MIDPDSWSGGDAGLRLIASDDPDIEDEYSKSMIQIRRIACQGSIESPSSSQDFRNRIVSRAKIRTTTAVEVPAFCSMCADALSLPIGNRI